MFKEPLMKYFLFPLFCRNLVNVQKRDPSIVVAQYISKVARTMFYVQFNMKKEDPFKLDITYLRHKGLVEKFLDELCKIESLSPYTLANYVKAIQL